MNKPNNPYFHLIEKSVECLEKNIEQIRTVTDWAGLMGFERSYFCASVNEEFDKRPKEILDEIRMGKIRESIEKLPEETSFTIARYVGLKDDQALYLFLSRHHDTNFTELRKKILNGDRD